MKAFLLAAGLGTRLKPLTDHIPKALATINGKSLLEINIRNLQRFGIFDIVINVHHFGDQIIKTLEKENGFGSSFQISDERNEVLETGGGLKNAAPFLADEKTFLVMNVDVISNFNLDKMIRQHNLHEPMATLAVQKRETSRYLLFDQADQLRGWENVQTGARKVPSVAEPAEKKWRPLAFSGIQLLDGRVFEHIRLDGRFSLIDLYLDICTREKIMAWNHSNDLWIDVGKPDQLTKAAEVCATFL